jgi:hypothetical protein
MSDRTNSAPKLPRTRIEDIAPAGANLPEDELRAVSGGMMASLSGSMTSLRSGGCYCSCCSTCCGSDCDVDMCDA